MNEQTAKGAEMISGDQRKETPGDLRVLLLLNEDAFGDEVNPTWILTSQLQTDHHTASLPRIVRMNLRDQEAVEPFRSEKRALLSLLSLDISLDNMISVMTGSAHVVVPIVDPAKKRNLSFFVAFVFRVARRPKGSPIELFSI